MLLVGPAGFILAYVVVLSTKLISSPDAPNTPAVYLPVLMLNGAVVLPVARKFKNSPLSISSLPNTVKLDPALVVALGANTRKPELLPVVL